MKMNRKLISLLLAVVFALTILAGCNGGTTTTTTTTQTTTESSNGGETTTGEDGFVINPDETELWNRIFEDWNRAWCEEMEEVYNSLGGNLIQEFIPGDAWEERISAARASNTAPDIFLMNYGGLPWNVADDLIQPLDSLIPQDAWDDLYDNIKDMITFGGQKYAYPQLVEPAVVMYYRKDVFAANGLDPESPPRTWDELIAAAVACTTDDMFGLGLNYEWSLWGWQQSAAGHMALTDDWSAANVNNDGYRDLLNFFKEAYESGAVPEQALGGYNDINPFAQDGLAITFCGSWGIGTIRNDYPELVDVVGIAAPPTKDGSPFQTTVGGWTYVIDAKSSNPEGGASYIYWLLGSDTERAGSFFEVASFSKYSPRISVDEYLVTMTEAQDDPWMQAVASDIIPYAVPEPLYAWDISAFVLTAVGDVVVNNMSVDDALAKAEASINTFIENNDYANRKPN